MAFRGQSQSRQKSTARWAELAILFCWYISQKAIVEFKIPPFFETFASEK